MGDHLWKEVSSCRDSGPCVQAAKIELCKRIKTQLLVGTNWTWTSTIRLLNTLNVTYAFNHFEMLSATLAREVLYMLNFQRLSL